ncbi:PREDICTED: uncharacterized protein LOC105564938 [Vollenhovia emeryi]|uniref:uncharacterized protein LOC105564938 n=1 Tax=Vollenhovia emeryi TaxID=411798 RepID=UPI0005F4CBCA|nr:PREDICTED: uncharacterized protein LOC105564938 [Vollenhovia emeryi]XP_011873111.1 PREDICTED: uncharacterized protein LOC105564938 [Vollenhovia emeryi]XP_011873112.1 PREDICTED: uncharacterized protein LOC105564938 [Vollenhovia emeryi]
MAYILSRSPVLCRSAFRKNVICGPVNKIILAKSMVNLPNRTNVWAEKKFKLQDNISNAYRLVYREESVINGTCFAAYHIGYIGLALSTFFLGYLILVKPPLPENRLMEDALDEGVVKPLTNVGRVVTLFISFVVSVVLIVSSRAFPFRIYHNPAEKMYKAVFVSRIFGKKQIETFGDGTVVSVFDSRRSLGDILFYINRRLVILDAECFPAPYVREQMIRKTESN